MLKIKGRRLILASFKKSIYISLTIVYYGDIMETIATKLTSKLVEEMDELINEGWYNSRSELLRDGLRRIIEGKRLDQLKDAVKEDIKWGLYED